VAERSRPIRHLRRFQRHPEGRHPVGGGELQQRVHRLHLLGTQARSANTPTPFSSNNVAYVLHYPEEEISIITGAGEAFRPVL
jgi:hypothetical protein